MELHQEIKKRIEDAVPGCKISISKTRTFVNHDDVEFYYYIVTGVSEAQIGVYHDNVIRALQNLMSFTTYLVQNETPAVIIDEIVWTKKITCETEYVSGKKRNKKK